MDHEDLVVLKTAWESVLKDLKGQVPETVLTRFLKRLEPVELREDCAVFNAPGRFVHDWVKDRYIDKLQALLIEALKRPIKLELRLANSQRPTTNNHAVAAVTPRTSEPGRFKPIERLTFDNFVVGQSNRLAVGGAKAIATAPGTRYNPLFIYGPSGLGKTHLLHAIANELLERDPYHSIMYVTAAQFMEDFVTALKNKLNGSDANNGASMSGSSMTFSTSPEKIKLSKKSSTRSTTCSRLENKSFSVQTAHPAISS
jgi:chromosomal replication initiator protein